MNNFSFNSVHYLICAKSSSHHPQLLAWINGEIVSAIVSSDYTLPKMGIFSEDTRTKDDTLFYLGDCVKEFGKLRLNRDKTKEVLSPSLTGISTSPSFHTLIYLCSEHDPTILKSILQNALEKCTEAEKKMNEEKEFKEREEKESKKREPEIQLGSENKKKAKVQHLDQAPTTISQQSQPKAISPPVCEVSLPLNALKSGVSSNLDSQIASQASTIQSVSPVRAQASTTSRCQSPQDINMMGPMLSPTLHLASSSEDLDPTSDKRNTVEDIQNWTGSEYSLDSEEDMEYGSDIHGEDCTVEDASAETEGHDCNPTTENASMSADKTSNGSEVFIPNPVFDANQSTKVTLEASSMPSPLRSSATTPPPSQETGLTNNPTKTKTPTIYEIELGLVRGEDEVKKYIMKECFPLGDDHRANNKWFSKADDLRELFPTCRKLPFRIVKDKLLRELESRIEVPGQKTAIPSTADLFNPSDIFDALQSIKMTTINAKVNRAYGQMRLYKSVQGKIGGVNYVPDPALKHGVTAHRSILAMMACCSAGKVSEKEQRDRINNFNYEYDAGKKWLDVAEWFGGEGIVLIFATAGG